VLFANTASGDVEESVRLLAELRETVPA